MEQPTIFGDNFETEFRIRRRSLLPVFLKVYIWIGFVLSVIFFLAILAVIGVLPIYTDIKMSIFEMAGFAGGAMIVSGIIFSMTAALWFEVKWAIRYNWVMGAIWLVIMLVNIIVGTVQIGQINGMVLTIPYWVMIYRIQYRWEREAVSKRELNMKTN